MSEKESTTRRRKMARRIRINVQHFMRNGIQRGDVAVVVMNGDVRVGELGYFKIAVENYVNRGPNAFAFVCEQDSTCVDGRDNGPRTSESFCLRREDITKCEHDHNATTYGRVCAVERGGQRIETKLALRPFNALKDTGEIIPIDSAENNPAGRTQRFAIIGKYDNALCDGGWINDGDVCVAKQGAPYHDGDLVVIRCQRCRNADEEHHHALFYRKCHGNKYSFRLCRTHRGQGGERYMAEDESIIIGPVEHINRKGQKEAEKSNAKKAQREAFTNTKALPLFGLHAGDTLIVDKGAAPQVGKLALMRYSDTDADTYYSRVCRVDGDVIRFCDVDDNWHDEPTRLLIGPVVKVLHEEDCTEKRVDALRAKLDRLGEEDDQIIRCTKRHEIEKQIYELEHPPEVEEDEGDSEFEWPEVIDDEGVLR